MKREKKLVVAAVGGYATVYESHGVRQVSVDEAVGKLPAAACIYTMCDRSGYDFLSETLADVAKDVYWFDLKAFGGMAADLLCHAMLFPSYKYTQPSTMVRLKDDFREFLKSALDCRVTEEQLGDVVSGDYNGSDTFHSFVESVSDRVGVKTVAGKKCLVELLLKLGHPTWTVMQVASDCDIVVRRLKVHVASSDVLVKADKQYGIDHPRQYVTGLYQSVTGKKSDLCKKDVNAMRRMVFEVFKLYRRKFCE